MVTDVGIEKAINHITVKFKPGETLPKRTQYPLTREASEGIQKTIEGLISAGVLMETGHPCNTPILPV